MRMTVYDNPLDRLDSIKLHIEDNAGVINKIVNDIIQPYVKDLDAYVMFIKECLQDGQNPPTDIELEDFCMNLSTYIYWAGGMCEQLGIKDDIAKAVYKETYNTNRNNIGTGTVADKDSIAELNSQQEQLISICYTRAYKTVKSKVDSAQELLSSCKKVLSRRMQDVELTRMSR